MMRCTFIKATPLHAAIIAENARAADVTELWASSRTTPEQAMLRGLERTVRTYTAMVDGEPVCMLGASPFSIMGGMAAAWMIGSSALDKIGAQKELLRVSPAIIDAMLDEFPNLLYNFVDQRNVAAIRWLKWLGFRFSDPIPYGVDGLPFLPFYRRRGM